MLLPIFLLIHFTSQFFSPDVTPHMSSYSIKTSSCRPATHIFLLPTLESILYGTIITHTMLDTTAWLLYRLFGYQNWISIFGQIILSCAASRYKIIYGTPRSAGDIGRIGSGEALRAQKAPLQARLSRSACS
ncbi:hypothetical protein CY34DRAFT_275298 [Suillus luteus UH-Slu-Lm8-n1]|uniref:Uncharacterized protein n=1 Tax=Suillus luteus UH-Slu-Lm8-n1 TaxID=930992 RepID=A0A0D0AF36_9AGAM|nr:hypothetical protein CY34DRAFT_275298 [Suillus luteus UH-Slu-Lm8-n1]